nr:ribonuclease H-like domain-containing protein [Tanacetum cinerariifolium]
MDLQDKGVIDSGCSKHMTENMSYLTDYEEIDVGYVSFEGNLKGGKITGREFLERTIFSVDLKNIVPKEGLTFLFAKATSDESKLWHRRLGHLNIKTMNTLVKGNLDETSGIRKSFITRIENLVDHNAKVIRCDNGTMFKNREMNKCWEMKGIMKQFSVARTPQQNRVAGRRNRTLIEAARTMLVDSKLPTTFWAEVVNTACYVQNRVLVVKPHNKNPYELFHGRTPALSFMRPFGCPVTILNFLDHLGKFNDKVDDILFVGYSLNSKAFRVFNSQKRIVEEKLHICFSENTSNVVGTKASDNVGQARKETEPIKDYILLPLWMMMERRLMKIQDKKVNAKIKRKKDNVNSTNNVNIVSSTVNVAGINELPFDPDMPALEDISTFNFSSDHEDDTEMADINNMDTKIQVSKREINKTLFIRRYKIDILLIQVFVDDIIFGLTNKELCNGFKKMMHKKFQMSSMGELTFFLGLQMKQKNDGIFISQDKYVDEILKKFGFTEVKNASKPIETQKPMLKDEDGEEVDVYMY